MGILLRRILVYLCLSLALALAVPLVRGPDKRHEQQTKTVVFLSALALTPRTLAPACSQGPYPLSDEMLQEKYPAVRRAIDTILTRGPEKGAVSISGSQPAALARALAGRKVRVLCFTHLQRIYRLKLHSWGGGARLWVVGLPPGAAPQLPRLDEKQLARYPELARYLQSLVSSRIRALSLQQARQLNPWRGLSKPNSFYRPVASTLPVRQWRDLLARVDLGPKWPAFRWGDFIIAGYEGSRIHRATLPVPGLFEFKMSAAVLLILIGLWLARDIYRRGPGISINPLWAGLFGDTVFILFLGFGALGVVDYLQVRWLHTIPRLDEAHRMVFSLMYLPCLIFMAWFVSNMVGQSLEVKQRGLVRHGPDESQEMAWEDIRGFELKESNLLVARGDVVLPRRLQTLLVIKTSQAEVILFEPGRRSIKRKIVRALAEQAPPRLQADIDKLAQDW